MLISFLDPKTSVSTIPPRERRLRFLRLFEGKLNDESRPLARHASDPDVAAMGLDDLGGDIETQSDPPEVL